MLGVIIFAGIVIVGGVVLIKSKWLPKHETGLVGLRFMNVAVSVVIDLIQGVGTILNPAKELAEQFDRDMAMESQLLPSVQAIAVAVLAANRSINVLARLLRRASPRSNCANIVDAR